MPATPLLQPPLHASRGMARLQGRQAGWKRPRAGLIQFVLLWFVLSLGAAIASPVIHPQSMEFVCSSTGAVKMIVHLDDGVQEIGESHLDCPLCLLGGPPPAEKTAKFISPLPLGRATQSIPSARIAAATASPLSARGPPILS